MQIQAMLHIPLSKDAYALDEKTLVIRFRAAKDDIASCSLFWGSRVCPADPVEAREAVMEKIAADQYFDYYEGKITCDCTRVCYYFRITAIDGETIFYSEYGFTSKLHKNRTQYFQFPYIRREDIIRTPEWVKTMVMYHIFPDSFASGKEKISAAKKQTALKNGLVSVSENGGTLRGIRENLDYLESLHINCIYLNPVFMAASYHKYDTIDYYEVDPCFGTRGELKELVQECHLRGIRIILDGVFNHCGSGFFAFADVLKYQEQSRYKDWFYQLTFPVEYKHPPNYEAFAYVKEMPKLNTGNPEVIDYFCAVGRYWIREVDIDGWRLDVANEVNHEFWRQFKRAVKSEKEDIFLIGEIWEDASVWLLGDQFDSTMNYNFSYICREFFAKQSIGIQGFDEKIHHMNLRYQENVSLAQMNFLDTHDVPRFLSDCGGDIQKLKLAVLYMMAAMGIPSIFYADEKAVTGVSEAEYRQPMPWKRKDTNELEGYYRKLIRLRRSSMALCQGSYRTILADEERKLYVFVREWNDEKVFVCMNLGEMVQEINLKQLGEGRYMDLLNNEEIVAAKIQCSGMEGAVLKKKEGR